MSARRPDPEVAGLARNVGCYYAYVLLGNLAFWLAIHVLYFQHRGLDFTEIMWLLFAQSACQVCFEVPSGVLSDRCGRKWTLALGAVLKLGFCALCMLDASFVVYLVASCLLGIHIALESGTDAALVYDTLDALGRPAAYTEVKSRGFALRMLGNGIGAVGGGYLAAVGYALPWLAAAVCCGLALLVTLLLREPPRRHGGRDITVALIVREGVDALRHNRRLLRLVSFGAVVVSVLLVGLRYQQPYLEQAGLALEAFGPVYLVWLVVSAAAALLVGRVGPRLDERRFLLALPALLAVQYLLLASHVSAWGVGIMLIGQVVVGVCRPMLTTYLNREVKSTARATVLSVNGFVQNLVLMIVAPAVGWLSDVRSMSTAFVALAITAAVGGGALALRLGRP